MDRVNLALLRGICQMPAYVAKEMGFFEEFDLDVRINMQPTAWIVPDRMARGEVQFAVIPWTRVASANTQGQPLVLVCGSGCEEAAVVVRKGLKPDQVQTLAVPERGGMKDLTANALMRSLGWENRKTIRLPSGDGAILALIGQAADAASMVEPYATMLQELGLGTILKRTGDMWPGAPGCSLATSKHLLHDEPELVQRMVAAFVKGATWMEEEPEEAADIASRYIGVNAAFIRKALLKNRPNVEALTHQKAMDEILTLMMKLGYLESRPKDYLDLGFLTSVHLVKT